MVAWRLNPALTRLRAAVDVTWPDRDRASDGTIGNDAHQATNSDHNPDPDGSVDAFDCDVQLHGPLRPPPAAELEELKRAFERHEAAGYWIHNDQIARRANGWRPEPYANYAGPDRNRHDKHIHFNTRASHENSSQPWRINVDPLATVNGSYLAYRAAGAVSLADPIEIKRPDGTVAKEPNKLAQRLAAIEQRLQTIEAGPAVDLDALADKVAARLTALRFEAREDA